MPVWSIIRGDGTTQTFEQALISNITRHRVNQDPDTAEVSFGRLGLAEPLPFADDEEIVVLRDTVRWFVGRKPATTPAATGSSESFTVTLFGPWWHLDNTIFMQRLRFVTSAAANDPIPAGQSGLDVYPTQEIETASIYLGEDETTQRVDTRGMILAALNYAISKGAPFEIGTVDPGVLAAREEYRSMTCGDVVRRCLTWTPGQAAWFDYTTTPPTLNIRERANRGIATVDLADEEVEEVDLVLNPGVAAAGVRLEYLRTHERSDFEFRTLDIDQVGPDPTGVGAMIVSIDLYGSYLVNDTVVAAEDVPVGVAAVLFAAYSVPTLTGTLKLARQDVGAEAWTDSLMNVIGGNPVWAAMNTDIQEAVDSTYDGRTTLTLGLPKHLGAQDLVNLVRRGRTQAPPSLADALVRGSTDSGGGAPATPSIPSSSSDPRAIFGPKQPAIVLINHTYQANNTCTGSGTVAASVPDRALYHATAAAGVSDTLLATALSVGEIVNWHGTTIGRGDDSDSGLCGGTCYEVSPGTHAPGPTGVDHNVYGDGTAHT